MVMFSKTCNQKLQNSLISDRSGNIFALLFGSVVLVGILGVSATSYAMPQNEAVSAACETGSVGTVCSDGAKYAGVVNGTRFYAAPNDEGVMQWSNVNSTTGAVSLADGLANTNILVGLGSGYQAATACRARGLVWYLPSRDELNVMYTNRIAIGGFDTGGLSPNVYYWSSSDYNMFLAWFQQFNEDEQYYVFKKHTLLVRCVRR